jgi:Putative bacterial sensory transduction regulator
VVNLPGTRRLKTACWLTVGDHALSIEAFVVRKPDEHAEQVYRYLLEHNARMYAVAWSIDDSGDVYLTGKLPLTAVTPDEIDRVLGAVLEYADGSFNALLQLGFGSSIRREWAWRVKNGESLANLAAFEAFAKGK